VQPVEPSSSSATPAAPGQTQDRRRPAHAEFSGAAATAIILAGSSMGYFGSTFAGVSAAAMLFNSATNASMDFSTSNPSALVLTN